jgi:hypothetical protein
MKKRKFLMVYLRDVAALSPRSQGRAAGLHAALPENSAVLFGAVLAA